MEVLEIQEPVLADDSIGHARGNGSLPLTEEKWEAIMHDNVAYNGKFFYAVKTTRIFCRPSCKSRLPNKENVLVFEYTQHAIKAGFRPCKRCNPTEGLLPDHNWVALIIDYIDTHYSEKLTLESLAAVCHLSPYHFHRTFRRIKGITPIEYVQQVRITRAVKYLIESKESIANIAEAVGIYNTSYFTTLFKRKLGQTPTEYRNVNTKKER
ncbi:bifunctional transcriptional activator/DNA repair enzyme AdaA [Bacillus sp. V5-8f]|uniref:bifunctional transcriptional activator/DNA repair enzyme AdaA n=1 Tax=Bacillus sp. V5-8f TaxID=2053044 RepID=UPI000C77978B|nr:bifunctional transcriptional activator/DNA repair enzyme AdaA [Bacillus sp. V5-8f]PLT35119.1 AraC family transcriptional regulator [Bacillus sp. V5-8f]